MSKAQFQRDIELVLRKAGTLDPDTPVIPLEEVSKILTLVSLRTLQEAHRLMTRRGTPIPRATRVSIGEWRKKEIDELNEHYEPKNKRPPGRNENEGL